VSPSDIPIHDIKPLIPIPDFIALIVAGLLVAAAAAIFALRRWRRHKKTDPRITWLKILDKMDKRFRRWMRRQSDL